MSGAQQAMGSAAGIVGIWGLFLTAVITAVKVWPALKKIQNESDASLRADLLARVGVLEARVTSLEKELAWERALRADAEHDLASERQSFDSFITLAEMNPDKVFERLPEIKETRRQHRERMAMKRGAREGTQIAEAG